MEMLLLVALMFVFGLTIIAPSLMAYTAHRHSEQLDKYLPRSQKLVQYIAPFKSMGITGKVVRCGSLAAVLLAPKFFARRGVASYEDLEKFPKKLKVKLVIPYIVLHISAILLVGTYWFV